MYMKQSLFGLLLPMLTELWLVDKFLLFCGILVVITNSLKELREIFPEIKSHLDGLFDFSVLELIDDNPDIAWVIVGDDMAESLSAVEEDIFS